MIPAVAAQVQAGPLPGACIMLKECRIGTPVRESSAAMIHPYSVAKARGVMI